MIKNLILSSFKGYTNESLEFKPLTILTGLNSTGKSSCFQAILFSLFWNRGNNAANLLDGSELIDVSFETNRNRYTNERRIKIEIKMENGNELTVKADDTLKMSMHDGDVFPYDLEKNIYYLSANRLGYSSAVESVSTLYKVGLQGEYIYGTYEREKAKALDNGLVRFQPSRTLSSQLNWWLEYILGIKLEMETEKVSSTSVRFFFKSDGIPNLEPRNLGVGVSYLTKVLIMCLRAELGDILMIENPEIHLHPAAQARLAEFFVMVANSGRQVLLETHSENMLNKLRYAVFKHDIPANNIVLYYKKGVEDSFICLRYDNQGRYSEEFPEGFYDTTLNELLEMD